MRRDASGGGVAEVEIGDDEQPVLFDVEDHEGSVPSTSSVQRSDASAELVEHLDGEGRVPPEPDQEAALGDHEELGAGDRHRVRIAGHRLQHGHLPEEVALTERRHHRRSLAFATGDLDGARLDHEHVDALLALAEHDLARFGDTRQNARLRCTPSPYHPTPFRGSSCWASRLRRKLVAEPSRSANEAADDLRVRRRRAVPWRRWAHDGLVDQPRIPLLVAVPDACRVDPDRRPGQEGLGKATRSAALTFGTASNSSTLDSVASRSIKT